jgi:hypothetical protein
MMSQIKTTNTQAENKDAFSGEKIGRNMTL